ncbi:hypothetical protein PLEOSDRAFT_160747 [Pleurotus ostreatus PC15]|uniref:F-box domain-containing protein n=1 Tax=Pleurotus ostreatus (strain PC15) TaxID=1137138 RepID=A0A067NGQ5_PLEO1|nr:hypothetical protein PLEOSDRAFT_160747 [Pleurotus ostreatus PC15]
MSTSWMDSRILTLPVDLAWMLISAILKTPRWLSPRFPHTCLLRSLEALFWQRPKSLEDMPFDVIFSLSLHLSVKDLCALRATSRQLRHLVLNRLLWSIALRDILEIRPIPRLSYALDDMSLEELLKATIRLNALDKKNRGLDPDVKLIQISSIDVGTAPVFVPGGRHFVTVQEPDDSFFIHDFGTSDLSAGRPFLPRFEHQVVYWRMVPVGATEFNIAVATLDLESYAVGPTGYPLDRSYVHVFHYDIITNIWEEIDYFYIDARFQAFYFDSQLLAMMWCHVASSHSAYIRDYARHKGTPVLGLTGIDLTCSAGSIVILDQCHFVVAADEVAHLFRLPAFFPISGTYVAGATVDYSPIWRSNTTPKSIAFRAPFVADMRPLSGKSPTSIPPTKWMVWSGDYWHVITQGTAPFEYNIERRRCLPGRPDYTVLGHCFGKFSALHGTSDEELFILPLPINHHPCSRGFARLNAPPDPDDMPSTEVPFHLDDEEGMVVLSYDEESGHVYIGLGDRELPGWQRIVAATLS